MSTAVPVDREASRARQSRTIRFSNITLQQLLISLSIANLFFLTMWLEVLGFAGSGHIKYFEMRPPDVKFLWALLADILIMAALVFLAFRLREKNARALRWAGTLFIAFLCVFAFYNLQRSLNQSLHHLLTQRAAVLVKITVAMVVLFFLIRFPKKALRAAAQFFLLLSPMFVVLSINGFWLYHSADLRDIDKGAAAGMLPARPDANRVIWIIFDELDQKLVFDARPDRIHLPEFDRLRAESIYADHVRSPAWDTLEAIPSLLMGRIVSETAPVTSDLRVKLKDGGEWVDFKSEPNVFSQARAAGFNTAVAGNHHPYCRILGSSSSDCAWAAKGSDVMAVKRFLGPQTPFYVALYLAEWQACQIPILQQLRWISAAPQLARIWQKDDIADAQFVTGNALRMLGNRNLNLVFLHFPVPHMPGIWNLEKQSFTTGDSNYIDNLQLCDKLLGEMRRVLEQTGDWDRSTILVSGDHPYRAYFWGSPYVLWDAPDLNPKHTQPYVPFLLKLPSQHCELHYTRPFNSVVSADLLLRALYGQLRTPAEAVAFLDAKTIDRDVFSSKLER